MPSQLVHPLASLPPARVISRVAELRRLTRAAGHHRLARNGRKAELLVALAPA
ncbi:MAG: hypothetical protein ACK587_00315 [Cyanobacteriota bacterium]|jgi:hypothetical protein